MNESDEAIRGRCAYCNAVVAEHHFSVEINAWGAGSAYGYAEPDFCSRPHLVAYFAEDRLPDIPLLPEDAEPSRVADSVGCLILLAIVALFAIGLITVVTWLPFL